MPRLGSLLVCEKIIQDQIGKPTLIALFQRVGAVVPEGQEMPKEAIAGIGWSIFSEWFFSENELSKAYEQVLEVTLPDGSPTPIKGRLKLSQPLSKEMGTRCFVNTSGVPISKVGFLSVNVWLECDSEKVTDVFSYLIQIEHTKQPPAIHNGGMPIHTFVPAQKAQ
jgi:hypothetical protein